MTESAESRTLVFAATYNERDNIEKLIAQIWQAVPATDILIVDDNSPDGTGQVLDQIAAKNPKLKVIHRSGKLGVGSAHKVAFRYARENGYAALVTMDADFSHDPQVIPKLLAALAGHDFVIGSRFAPGGSLDYSGFRLLISRGANFLARTLLGIIPYETTTSFRAFGPKMLASLPIENVQADGYSFFLECTYLICRHTNKVFEIPIHFLDRVHGKSKISNKEILNGFLTLFRLFFSRIFGGAKSKDVRI